MMGLTKTLQWLLLLQLAAVNCTEDATVQHHNLCPDTCNCVASNEGLQIRCSSFPTEVPSSATSLSIWNAKEDTLNRLSFPGPLNIKSLSITSSGLTKVQPDAFQAMPQLKSLQLSRNSLVELSVRTFSVNIFLEKLFLDNNGLAVLPNDLFESLENLQVLDLHGNKLVHIPMGLPRSLVSLNIAGNLMIDDNSSTTALDLPNLKMLNLCGNHFSSFSENKFVAPGLEILCLGDHRVSVNTSTLQFFGNIKELTLKGEHSDNSTMDENFVTGISTLTNLQSLTIKHYVLPRIDFIRNLTLLRKLELQYVPGEVTVEGSEFDNLTALRYLDLEGSASLASNILHKKSILTEIKNIKFLSLRSTNLTAIPSEEFKILSALTTLDISADPLECSCNTRWLAQEVQQFKLPLTRGDATLCDSPAEFKGQEFAKALFCSSGQPAVTSSVILPNYTEHKQEYLIVGSVLIVLVVSVIAFAIYYHQVRKRSFFRVSWGKLYFQQPLKRSPSADSLI